MLARQKAAQEDTVLEAMEAAGAAGAEAETAEADANQLASAYRAVRASYKNSSRGTADRTSHVRKEAGSRLAATCFSRLAAPLRNPA